MTPVRYPRPHPVRSAVLELLEQHGTLSVIGLHRALDENGGIADAPEGLAVPSLSTLCYHVRVLAEKGAITLDHVELVRGSVAHHYTLTDDAR